MEKGCLAARAEKLEKKQGETCAAQKGVDDSTERIVECLRKVERRMQELTKRRDGIEGMVGRLTERVGCLEGSRGRTTGTRERSSQRRLRRKALDDESSKSPWQWGDGAWWLRVECGWLNSRRRRKVPRSVRHALDEEENRRNDTWRERRSERLFTRIERREADVGLLGGTLMDWGTAVSRSTGGEVASGFVRGESAPVEGHRRVACVSRFVRPGLVLVILIPGSCSVSGGARFM